MLNINSNLFHNLANIATLVLAGGTAVLAASGCVTLPTGAIDCSGSWLNPAYTAVAIALLQSLKLVVNIMRDGLNGLTKPQPPVQK